MALNVVPISLDDADDKPTSPAPPLASSYKDKIRPLLDAVDGLRRLKVTQEGIPLPTIVVVGDQSSGKSSVLESLAGISLPRGQGICTRVPLIMRLQHKQGPLPELSLEFSGKVITLVDETKISEAINLATDEVAGAGKGISKIPLTLVVKKNGVPDLTMVDLPGITRVPVHGQPDNIYEQISDIIMEYIKPEESIILNVLSATVDFPTCESIRMSQKVDTTGQRTLAVVTKADQSPEGLLEKVMADDVNIGLGYVCVKNRVGNETYAEARINEAELFETHPLLSKIDRSMVGIPVLAQRLVMIQSTIISKCLPDIVKKINDKLNMCVLELNKLPKNFTSSVEAVATFIQIIGLSKDSLRKLLITGEFNEYPDDKLMHSTARLSEMIDEFSKELQKTDETNSTKDFLVEEIKVLEEANGIWLPNFLPRSAFHTLLRQKVLSISEMPSSFVEKVWDYIEMVVGKVLVFHSENYPQLHCSFKKASEKMITNMRVNFMHNVLEIVEMEKVTDYTCDPAFLAFWDKLMQNRSSFVQAMEPSRWSVISIEGFGNVNISHLRSVSSTTRDLAFDLKMRITSYWKIVLKRLVDWVALHLQFTIHKLVNTEMESEIAKELVGGKMGIELMMEESPSVGMKRERLNNSIKLLKSSKDVVGKVMDKITFFGEKMV